MRRALLAIIGIETLVWLYLVIGGLNDALFFAKGYGREAAQLANMVFMLLVLPAGILAIANRLLPTAALLAGVAGLAYAFDPFLRLMALIGA
jgi:hypothetical protein